MKSLVDYRTDKTTNRWRSVDAHSKNGAVTALLSLLPITAANMSVMHNNDQVTSELPYLQDQKSLTLRWRSFWFIVHSTSAAIHNCFHPDLTVPVGFLLDWDSPLWQSRAASSSCTVHSHTTKNNVSGQKIHCACNTSIYEQIFTSYLPFAHNISRTETLGQATKSWWTIDAFCPTFSSLLFLSGFQVHWRSLKPFQPVTLTSMSAKPIRAHIWRGAHILLLWGFRILDAIVVLYIGVIVRSAILLAVIWILQVAIPVEAIYSVRNAVWCAIVVAFDWMTGESLNTADIQDLSSSSREVLCRQSRWQRWFFWQFKCSRTIMLEEWPGCVANLFRVRNVSYSGHLLVPRAGFLLCST